MAINITNINETYFTVTWTSHGSTVEHYNIEVMEGSTLIHGIYGIASNVTSYNIMQLKKGTQYEVKLYSRNSSNATVSIEYAYPKTAGTNRPDNWQWTITKRNGASYNISNSQVTNLVSLSEIIGFQNRINEFRAYKGVGSYTFASRSRGEVYSTFISNQLRASINEMSPPISASSLTNVIDNLNRMRDSLNSIQ